MAASAEFHTTVVAAGNNTGIRVPDEVIQRLGAGHRPPVVVSVNGYAFRYTIGVMGGKHLIGISAAIRKETGLKGGDPIDVVLTLAESPRAVTVPEDFAEALSSDPVVATFFKGLSNSLQRYHIDSINAAKSPATRQRRIDKAISLFQQGKQR